MTRVILAICVSFFLVLPASAGTIDVSVLKEDIASSLALQRLLLSTQAGGHTRQWRRSAVSLEQYSKNSEEKFGLYIHEAAKAHRLPPELLKALIRVESGFDPWAVSGKGCIGLTQLAPGTAAELGVDPRNVRQNIMGGASYFRKMYDRYGSVEEALWAYNAGPARVDSQTMYDETRRYIRDVMKYWRQYQR